MNRIFLLLTVFYAVSSCMADIDLHTDDGEQHLIIYGYITNETKQHSIQLSRSVGFFANGQPAGVRDAVVTISSDDQHFVLTESATEPGLYQTDAGAYGVAGKTYTLDVSVDGQAYRAVSYLNDIIDIDTIVLRPSDAFKNAKEIALFTPPLPETSNYYSFHFYNGDIALTDSLFQFTIISDEYVDGSKGIDGMACYYFLENKQDDLITGNLITIRIDAITKEYYDHLSKAKAEVGSSIPIFSGPAANVGTNIQKLSPADKTPVAGFFTAYSSRSKSTVVE
ncbi:MAG: DUF4249 domain-containing protein [Bacteroidales bacterium]|jgi:hypothetical protein|nr:DUF4249 domain-containing protein [Bacteroidales bacterium]